MSSRCVESRTIPKLNVGLDSRHPITRRATHMPLACGPPVLPPCFLIFVIVTSRAVAMARSASRDWCCGTGYRVSRADPLENPLMGFRDNRHRLGALASAELTYRELGATRGELPSGYEHLRRDVSVGTGPAAFARATAALLAWRMHRGAGLTVTASGPAAAPGVIVLLRAGWGPLSVVVPCRVVYCIDQPDSRGFAYGTLPGHPEQGEEAFVVQLLPNGDVRLLISAFSRHASQAARAAGPLTRKAQAFITDRYISALRRLARPDD